MPSLARYIRGIRAVGLKEWWHQMQYIGDVKAGTFMGSDQCVSLYMSSGKRFLNIGRRPQIRKPLFRESQRRTGSARYTLSCVRGSMEFNFLLLRSSSLGRLCPGGSRTVLLKRANLNVLFLR